MSQFKQQCFKQIQIYCNLSLKPSKTFSHHRYFVIIRKNVPKIRNFKPVQINFNVVALRCKVQPSTVHVVAVIHR